MNTQNNNADYWFARVDINVARDKELSMTAKFIFMILCTFADKDKRGCWPSNEKVAEAAGVSIPTLKRAYKELEARGVISREARFNDGQQTSSYTLIVGHNAPCYGGFTSEPPGGSSMSHRTRINEQDIKDSLTREAELPEATQSDNPKEVCTPDDAPDIMKPTAEYLLYKTGRKALTWEEISALRTLSASHYPSRVQKEIDTACERFRRKGRSLNTLTFNYIAGSLQSQVSRTASGRKVKKHEKPLSMTSDEIRNSGKAMTLEEAKRYLEEAEGVRQS